MKTILNIGIIAFIFFTCYVCFVEGFTTFERLVLTGIIFILIQVRRIKTKTADLLNISVRTLDRKIPYENDNYIVYLVSNVVL